MTVKIRALKAFGDYLYAVVDRKFIRIDDDGVVSTLGLLNANGPYVNGEKVAIESNMFSVSLADGVDGYTYNLSTELFREIPSFPGGHSMAFMKGFLFTEAPGTDGKVFRSDVFDSLVWNGLNYGSVEARPDPVLRVHAQNDVLYMLGRDSIEAWYHTGATGFAFAPLPGSALNYGLAAVDSVVPFKGGLAMLVKSGGDLMVAVLAGYALTPISRTVGRSSALEAELQGYARVDDAVATAYTIRGHTIYQISFPSEEKTWAMDGATGIWFRLQSGIDGGMFCAELAAAFDGKIIMSDRVSGNLWEIDPEKHTDVAENIRVSLTSEAIKDEGSYHNLERLWLDFEVGETPVLPSGEGYDPFVFVELSPDGGRTWKPGRRSYLGRQGEGKTRVQQYRWGRFLSGVVRVSGQFPVNYVLAETGIRVE